MKPPDARTVTAGHAVSYTHGDDCTCRQCKPFSARQPIPVIGDRARMLEQIDAMEAQGAPVDAVAELREGVHRLRLPDDQVTATLTHADAQLGAFQLRMLVRSFGDRMPDEAAELLLRVAAVLGGAR